jgi:hypothetical protein
MTVEALWACVSGAFRSIEACGHISNIFRWVSPSPFISGYLRQFLSTISFLPIKIFLLLSGASLAGLGWRATGINVSVAAVRHRAFVFAAPLYFVAGNRSTKYRGAVSVGTSSSARGDVT